MPDVHIPKLDAHGGGGRSIFKVVLEVAFIGVGVFLGLMGEQWRESRRHHELADEALRRFRTELTANRQAIASVRDYHADRFKELRNYFDAKPADRSKVDVRLTKGMNPAFLERSAWDLAIATQSLSYINTDLAVQLSRAYNTQLAYTSEGAAFVQGMFARPPTSDLETFLGQLYTFFGDSELLEPRLITQYDEVLARIDKALK